MSDKNTTLHNIKIKIRNFIKERSWEKAHSPKNLSMSLSIETAELMEHFQWISEDESRSEFNETKKEEIKDELADVAIYLIDLCDILGVDLSTAIDNKLVKNSQKYPVNEIKH